MKKKIRLIIWLALTVALVVIAARAPKVSADEEPAAQTVTVQLSAAQSLALFGQSFQALYYDNGTVRNVTFEFDKSSRTVVDQCDTILDSWTDTSDQAHSFFPSGVQNGITSFLCNTASGGGNGSIKVLFNNQLYYNSDWLGIQGGSIIDYQKLYDYEFLMYKCEGIDTQPVSSNTFDFQLNIQFPFVLSGVEHFQSIFCSQVGIHTPSLAYSVPVEVSNTNLGSEVRIYSSSNSLYPVATTSDTHISGNNGYFGYFCHPLNTADPSHVVTAVPTPTVIDRILSYYGVFGMCIFDTDINSSYELTGINWNIRNCNSYFAVQKQNFNPEYVNVSDPNSANYQWQDNAVYLMVMCPRIQGEFTIGRPSGSGSYIDYTDSLDKLISGSDATNNKLDIIIQKLDRIYNQMVADNGGVDLIAPETIGFTAQQKQQILQGASGLDSEFSSITPETFEEEQEAAGAFWDFWDRLIGVFPPKLLVAYTFIMISGAVSWIIYARRG